MEIIDYPHENHPYITLKSRRQKIFDKGVDGKRHSDNKLSESLYSIR